MKQFIEVLNFQLNNTSYETCASNGTDDKIMKLEQCSSGTDIAEFVFPLS